MVSMRRRAPLLYHEYVGQYDPQNSEMKSTATTLWESILENMDAADYHERLEYLEIFAFILLLVDTVPTTRNKQ